MKFFKAWLLVAVVLAILQIGASSTGTFYEIILGEEAEELVKTFPRWWEDKDEPEDVRNPRMETLTRAMLEASNNDTRRLVLLMTVAWWESRLASHVHAGNCKPTECDGGRARGVAQVQLSSGVDPELWNASEGHAYDNTLANMKGASWVFDQAVARCGQSVGKEERLFYFYAKGKCSGPLDKRHPAFHHLRADWFNRKMRALRKGAEERGVLLI